MTNEARHLLQLFYDRKHAAAGEAAYHGQAELPEAAEVLGISFEAAHRLAIALDREGLITKRRHEC